MGRPAYSNSLFGEPIIFEFFMWGGQYKKIPYVGGLHIKLLYIVRESHNDFLCRGPITYMWGGHSYKDCPCGEPLHIDLLCGEGIHIMYFYVRSVIAYSLFI